MASIRKTIAAALEKEFVEGTVFRVDMDRVDVAPNGSTGILRSLPLTGNREKVQPGDPVRIITVAGERVALVGDIALSDAPSEEVADASEIIMEENLTRERSFSLVGSSGGTGGTVNAISGEGIVDPTNNQILVFDGADQRWENRDPNFAPVGHTHSDLGGDSVIWVRKMWVDYDTDFAGLTPSGSNKFVIGAVYYGDFAGHTGHFYEYPSGAITEPVPGNVVYDEDSAQLFVWTPDYYNLGAYSWRGIRPEMHTHYGYDITTPVPDAFHATDADNATNATNAANASKLSNLSAATSGANAHIVATDANGYLHTSRALGLTEMVEPATPSAGWGYVFQGSDGYPRMKNDGGQVFPMGLAEIIVPVMNWHPASGAPLTPVNSLVHWGREFRDNTVDAIDTNIVFPLGWRGRNLYLDVNWCCSVGTGNVWWIVEGRSQRADAVLANTLVYNPSSVVAAPGYFVKTSTFNCGSIAAFDNFSGASFRIYRYGTHASDTALGTAYVLATRFRVV